ncbi:hypothetical protein C8J57DRAFT_1326356 [Mycena rebaudengoi]|nr:hypothetical protein C8J57DRAFT_1326356 [Mycena rebaudengoi]
MESYVPLLREGEFPNDEGGHISHSMGVCDCGAHDSKYPDVPNRFEKRAMKFAVYACLASLMCTFLNVSFLAARKLLVTNDIKDTHIPLETPNSYFGLENAFRDASAEPPRPILNVPFFASQVNESEPNAIYYEIDRKLTYYGTAYPTDRKFMVAPGISTIVQYRVQDFGMEKCILQLSTSIPPEASGHDHGRDIDAHSMGQIDLWKLDHDRRLDRKSLSWGSRPRRLSLTTTWDVSKDAPMETVEFPCATNSILTFELACARHSECRLEFIQPRVEARAALFLVQSSSL